MTKKKWIIIGVSIAVVLAGIGGFFYYKSEKDKQALIDSIQLEFVDNLEFEYGSTLDVRDLVKSVDGEVNYPELDTTQLGKQTLVFKVTKDGYTKEFNIDIEIKDKKAPEIALSKEKVTLDYKAEFDPVSCIASVKDDVDGDLTYKKIADVQEGDTKYYTYESDVKTDKAGSYIVKVIAVDSSQNKSEKEVTVVVNSEKKTVASSGTTSTETYVPDKANKVIVIDPGHQGKGNSAKEAVGPGSSTMKAKVSSGATGISTKIIEAQTTLTIGLKLKSVLQARGYTVIMTRTSQDVNISNQQRAAVGNNNNAAAVIHLHCDSNDSSSVRGAHTIAVPTNSPYTSGIASASQSLARKVIDSYCSSTGIKNRGISLRNDLTGLNWSKVPSIYIEMGFISNSEEDKLLNDSSFQDKCAKGIANGIDNYFK